MLPRLKQLRGYLSELFAPQEELVDVSPATPAEIDAALDWLLDQQLADQAAEVGQRVLSEAAAADGPGLERIQIAVDRQVSGVPVKRKMENPRNAWTVQELGEAWTSGTLATEFPDQIRARRSADDDISRLEGHVYPAIGALKVRDVKLAELERVVASLKGSDGRYAVAEDAVGASRGRHRLAPLARR